MGQTVNTINRSRPAVSPLFAGLLSLLFLAACSSSSEPPKPPKKKNVLLITLDALRQDHISAFGYFRQTSPNIDWLTINGVAFRRVITTGCSPRMSLTSLVTSQPYAYSQLEGRTVLRESNETLAETFAAAGYRTAAFVASPILASESNFDQGFQTYVDFAEAPAAYITADLPVQAAIDHLKTGTSKAADAPPFFIHLHLQEPHPPWTHGSPWLSTEEKSDSFFNETCNYIPSADELALVGSDEKEHLIAKYDGSLHFADEQIGALLKELRTDGRLKNTIVAVTSPYGIELLDRFSVTHDYNPFDEVIRTFLIVFDQSASFKDAIPDALQARIFDVGPTLMGLADVTPPEGTEGVDLLGPPQDMPEFAFTRCANADTVRSIDFKLISVDLSRLRDSERQLPVGLDEGVRLYVLRSDPREEIDARESRPDQLARMQEALNGFRAALGREPVQMVDTANVLKPKTRERLRVLGYDAPAPADGGAAE